MGRRPLDGVERHPAHGSPTHTASLRRPSSSILTASSTDRYGRYGRAKRVASTELGQARSSATVLASALEGLLEEEPRKAPLAFAAADDQVHLRAAHQLLPRPRPLRDHAALSHGRRLRLPDPAGAAVGGDDSTFGSRQWLALHVRDDAEHFLRNQAEGGGHGLDGVDRDRT